MKSNLKLSNFHVLKIMLKELSALQKSVVCSLDNVFIYMYRFKLETQVVPVSHNYFHTSVSERKLLH